MFNLFNQKALNRINSEEFYDNDQNACIFWFKNLNPIVVYGNKEHPSWKCINLDALPYIRFRSQEINFSAREFMLIGKPEFIRAYYDAVVSNGVASHNPLKRVKFISINLICLSFMDKIKSQSPQTGQVYFNTIWFVSVLETKLRARSQSPQTGQVYFNI